MKNKKFEKTLQEALEKQTSEITKEDDRLKEKMWHNIQMRTEMKSSSRKWIKGLGAALASTAVLLIGIVFFTSNSEPEQVVMQSLRDTFVERKTQVVEIEGQKEETSTQLEANEELSYIIYIDEDRYQMIQNEGVDRIEMLEVFDGFPEVAMEIWREEHTTSEEVVENIRQEIQHAENMNIRREERVTEPIEATMIQGMGLEENGEDEVFGTAADTPIHRYYVTDTINDQVFVIKQIYFLEAAEGHGARFHYMLETFEIVQ